MLNEILREKISISYTLKSYDIGKGKHPFGTPYVSRKGEFD